MEVEGGVRVVEGGVRVVVQDMAGADVTLPQLVGRLFGDAASLSLLAAPHYTHNYTIESINENQNSPQKHTTSRLS